MHIVIFTEELLIDFCELVGKHSGENLADAVWQTMKLYGLQGCVGHAIFCSEYNLIVSQVMTHSHPQPLDSSSQGLSKSSSIIRIEIMDEFSYPESIHSDSIIIPCPQ